MPRKKKLAEVEDLTGNLMLEGAEEDSVSKDIDLSKNISPEDLKKGKALMDDFQSTIFNNINEKPDQNDKPIFLPTGIDILDTILGGGFVAGMVQIAGPPGCGKSTLIARAIANCQLIWPGNFISAYIDTESAMTKERLTHLEIKNPPMTPYNDSITVEKVFKFLDQLCTYKENNPHTMEIPSMLVWDSLANTLPEVGLDEKKSLDQLIGRRAAILSFLMPKYVSKLRKYKICFVVINQIRDKFDLGVVKSASILKKLGDKTIPGGNNFHHNASQFLMLNHISDYKGGVGLNARDDNGSVSNSFPFSGCHVKAQALKNKTYSPHIEIKMVMSYRNGFSNFWTNYQFLKDHKIITSGGGWVTINGYSGPKFRQESAYKEYMINEEFKTVIDQAVKDTIDSELIKKYKTMEQYDEDSE